MCSKKDTEFEIGYIASPEYPSNLGTDLSCPCYLQSETKIILEVI
jgi:hypothetical protein